MNMENENHPYGKTREIVQKKINYINYIDSTIPGKRKALLAQLRRGLGKSLDQVPELWELILEKNLTELTEKENINKKALEEAIYGALVLYAFACQKAKNDPHKVKVSFGLAVGRLVERDESNRDSIGTRLKSVLKTKSGFQATVKMRPLISMIAQKGEKFDFAQLAEDLYWLSFPASRKKVHLNWARNYIQGIEEKKEPKTKNEGEEDHE